jgi:aspartyl/asparaginyl-tRNA synthetase
MVQEKMSIDFKSLIKYVHEIRIEKEISFYLLSDKEIMVKRMLKIQLKDVKTIENTIIKVCEPDEFSKIEVIQEAIINVIAKVKDNDKKAFSKEQIE